MDSDIWGSLVDSEQHLWRYIYDGLNETIILYFSRSVQSRLQKKHHSNLEYECHSFHLALWGQTCSYSYTTRDSAIINNFQNHTVLFLLSTVSTQSTESTMSLLKIEILKFFSVTDKRRGDTDRVWPHGSRHPGPGEKGCHFPCTFKFTKEQD